MQCFIVKNKEERRRKKLRNHYLWLVSLTPVTFSSLLLLLFVAVAIVCFMSSFSSFLQIPTLGQRTASRNAVYKLEEKINGEHKI